MLDYIHSLVNDYGVSLFIPEDVVAKAANNPFLRNLTITKIGYYGTAKGHFIEREGINEYVLLYCIDGKGWVSTCGRRREVSRGHMIFCEANRAHAYGADSSDPWAIHWVHFIGEGVPELLNLLGITEHSPVLHIGEHTEFVSIFNEAYKTLYTGYSLPNLLYSCACLQQLLSHAVRLKMNKRLSDNSHIDIENVISFMLKNINQDITLQKFADNVCLSKYHFTRKFKERTGYSPIEYFNRLKIQRACDLLDTSSFGIKEISDMLGFNTPYYFSEVFRRIIGCSPKKYRQIENKSLNIPQQILGN